MLLQFPVALYSGMPVTLTVAIVGDKRYRTIWRCLFNSVTSSTSFNRGEPDLGNSLPKIRKCSYSFQLHCIVGCRLLLLLRSLETNGTELYGAVYLIQLLVQLASIVASPIWEIRYLRFANAPTASSCIV